MITFTPSERKALVFIIIILTAASLTHIFYPYIYQPYSPDYTGQDSIFKRCSKLQPDISPTEEKLASKKISSLNNHTSGDRQANEMNLLISINTASAGELQKLPGIGPVLARRILDYRTRHGEFHSIEELKKVKGIGPKMLIRLKRLIKI